MRISVPMGIDHSGPLGCPVPSSTRWLWLGIRCSLSKNLMALACIADSPTSLNIGLRGCQPSNSVIHLASSCSLSHLISQLTSHLSIWVYDVKLNAHMSHIYGWWIDLTSLHCEGSVRKKIMVFFGLQLTSCNLQCIEKSLLNSSLT